MKKQSLYTIPVIVVVLFILGCSIKKPSEQSLLAAFENDLLTYGFDLDGDYVRYSVGSDVAKGFQNNGSTEWVSNAYYNSRLKVTKVQINNNESERFPYRGTVDWNWQTLSFHTEGSTEYLFGKKTKTWIRVEQATME